MAGTLAVGAGCGALEDPASGEAESASEVAVAESFAQALSDSPGLIARVMLNQKHAFEFYEIAHGVVAYSEVAEYSELPTGRLSKKDVDDLEPLEIYRRLAPGTPLPKRLLDFDRRRRGDPAAPAAILPGFGSQSAEPELSVTRQAYNTVDNTVMGGQAWTSCPFGIFKSVSGPLGPFCPSNMSYNWCWANLAWAYLDGMVAPVQKRALSTICVDAGLAEFRVTVREGSSTRVQTFWQPAGTWRQWRTDHRCTGGFFTPGTCYYFKVHFNLAPGNGWSQFGGGLNYI